MKGLLDLKDLTIHEDKSECEARSFFFFFFITLKPRVE